MDKPYDLVIKNARVVRPTVFVVAAVLTSVAVLAALVNPRVGLITNAGAEHLEGFGSIEGAASSLLDSGPTLSPETRRELAETILDDLPGMAENVKRAISTLVPVFNTNRMVSDYAEKFYIAALDRGAGLFADGHDAVVIRDGDHAGFRADDALALHVHEDVGRAEVDADLHEGVTAFPSAMRAMLAPRSRNLPSMFS